MHGRAGLDFQSDIDAVAQIRAVPSILDVVCRMTGMGFAAVARVTEERWIACGVQDNIEFGLQPGGELKIDTTICHEIRQNHDPVVINCVADDPCYKDHHTPRLYGFQSYISVPITLRDGSFFGTLCAIDPEPHKLDAPEIIGAFTLFAEMIASQLDAQQKLVRSEETLVHERETAQLREQFIAVLGHDLRNPLAAVKAGADMLIRHPERAPLTARLINQSISRMVGLIDNLLDFARGRLSGGLALVRDSEEPVEATLGIVVQELQSTHPDQVIDPRFAILEPVSCDRVRIAQLLSNLLGNALTHGDKTKPVTVQGSTAGGVFELSVANAGEPIPSAALGKLFEPFFRASVRPRQEGLGLGLHIASEIAKAHDGDLTVNSTAEETRFTFRMPTRA
jgi:signal transduction histidine kinase